MKVIQETARLTLREIELGDAAFVFELMNEAPWIRYIGDRGIRTLADARAYIADTLRASYRRDGFGFWLTELTEDGTPLGICGMVKRESLEYPDIGFAFKRVHWGNGYAREAAEAVIDFARKKARAPTLAAIANPDNDRSARLLEKLGLGFDRRVRIEGDDNELDLYLRDL
jgi:RimJ/RimL family protein N-acetyltransferase